MAASKTLARSTKTTTTRVSELPRMTVRLPLATIDTLAACAALRRLPRWRMLDRMIHAYAETLLPRERAAVAVFVTGRSRVRPKGK